MREIIMPIEKMSGGGIESTLLFSESKSLSSGNIGNQTTFSKRTGFPNISAYRWIEIYLYNETSNVHELIAYTRIPVNDITLGKAIFLQGFIDFNSTNGCREIFSSDAHFMGNTDYVQYFYDVKTSGSYSYTDVAVKIYGIK